MSTTVQCTMYNCTCMSFGCWGGTKGAQFSLRDIFTLDLQVIMCDISLLYDMRDIRAFKIYSLEVRFQGFGVYD